MDLLKFVLTEETRIFNLFGQHMDHGLILWSVILNFDGCMICWIFTSIYQLHKLKKIKLQVQMLVLYLIVKMKLLQMCFMKMQALMIISHMTVLIHRKIYLILFNRTSTKNLHQGYNKDVHQNQKIIPIVQPYLNTLQRCRQYLVIRLPGKIFFKKNRVFLVKIDYF